jgi:hypothetical protein
LVRVTFLENIANDVRVLNGGTCCAAKKSVRVTSPENIATGVRGEKGDNP